MKHQPNQINRILITGSQGYIGSVLLPYLSRQGFKTIGLDTDLYSDCIFTDDYQAPDFINKDIRDITLSDLTDIDAVIHLAAVSNDPLGELDPELTLDINHRSTTRIAELAKSAGVKRFIFASSCSLYGKSDQDWMTEESPVGPLTAYALSKVRAEEELLKLDSDLFKMIILRCATVYGAAPKLRVDIVVNNLVGLGFTRGSIQLLSDGSPWRPLIHVLDLARVYEFFLKASTDRLSQRVFNIGFNQQNYTIRDIAQEIQSNMPESRIELAQVPDKDSRSYRVNFDRLFSISSIEPEWNLQTGIRQLMDGYSKHNLSSVDFEGRKFTRLKQIRYLLDNNMVDGALRWRSN